MDLLQEVGVIALSGCSCCSCCWSFEGRGRIDCDLSVIGISCVYVVLYIPNLSNSDGHVECRGTSDIESRSERGCVDRIRKNNCSCLLECDGSSTCLFIDILTELDSFVSVTVAEHASLRKQEVSLISLLKSVS